MRRLRFSPRSSFARTLLLIVTLLFASLVTTYLVVLNFAILPSLQQFNKVLAYEVRMLMTDKLQLEDARTLLNCWRLGSLIKSSRTKCVC